MERDADFAEYVAARWERLVRSVVFLGCEIDEARDLTQTTLMRAYRSWERVSGADDRDSYVYAILLNCLRDSRRRRWWGERPRALVPDVGLPDGTAAVDVADQVHRALGGLSEVNKQVVVLRFYADLSEQQISQMLGVPPGTVKSRLSRALHQLSGSEQLTDYAEGGSNG